MEMQKHVLSNIELHVSVNSINDFLNATKKHFYDEYMSPTAIKCI